MRAGGAWSVAAAACLVGFVGLAGAVTSSTRLAALDLVVQQAVVGHRSPPATATFHAFTALGTLPWVVGTTLTGVWILVRRTRHRLAPLVLAASVSLSALTVALVKLGVARPRPGPADRIGPAALDFAFPSGHTGNGTAALCLVTVLVCLTVPASTGRTAALAAALLLSVGIGLSRVYLGYHWPSDVVGGWLLAAALTCAVVAVVRRPVRGARPVRDGSLQRVGAGAPAVRAAEPGR